MSKHEEMQRFIRYYKQETGEREVDMKAVAEYAVMKGWKLPQPIDPMDRLAKDFAAAAREETRTDIVSGQPYRVNHVYTADKPDGTGQYRLWVDIDEAPRGPMQKSLAIRREQIVGDITQLSFDAEHWNRINPKDEPIEIEKDFGLDVEIRRNTPREEPAVT